jgi:opacity protein-like surface antigen
MKKTLAALVGGIALCCAAVTASAQTYRNEISLFGSWEDVRDPVDFEQSHLFARYGRFVSPQLVGTLGLQRSRLETGGRETTNLGITVGAKYYIQPPKARVIAPFVEAAIGAAMVDDGSEDSTDLTWELGGGVSWFFTEATSFDASLRFFQTNTDIETKGTRLFVGITTRF